MKQLQKELAAIAEVDLNTYGLEMLKAGTNLSDKSAAVLLDLDAKVSQWAVPTFVSLKSIQWTLMK